MASFWDALRIIRRPRSPLASQTFFEPVIAQAQLGNRLL
jgi:hypothetical protein